MATADIHKAGVALTYSVADHCKLVWATLELHRSIEEVDFDEDTASKGPTRKHRLKNGD